jgi:tRNA(Arg) A34 adenosine deaminase TadA
MIDTTHLATGYGAQLPGWVMPFLSDYAAPTGTSLERMALVHALADRNFVEGNGGPFAAVVADPATAEIISVGVNVVLSSQLSSSHAEVTAISLAQGAVGSWDLATAHPGLELVVNWRPCAMCFGAVLWSGVERLVVAGDGPELEQLTGFDEGPVVPDWAEQLHLRGIEVEQDVLREGAIATFAEYGKSRSVVYNARRGE